MFCKVSRGKDLTRFKTYIKSSRGKCHLWRQNNVTTTSSHICRSFSASSSCNTAPSKTPVKFSNILHLKKCSLDNADFQCHKINLLLSQGFHTTSRRHVSPIVWVLVIKPVAMVATAIAGKKTRNWYMKQNEDDRHYYENLAREKWLYPAGVFLTALLVYYLLHIDKTPITGRRRFISFERQHSIELAELQAEMIKKMFEDDRYNDNDPPAKRVRTVAHKLITSNQDLGNVGDWEIHVIKNENRNAFVLPSGHIFVFSGLLKVANNENQLAIVLGHEMSHAVLDHGAESMSMRNFTDDIFIVCLFFIWCMSPSYLKGVALSWFCHSLFDFLLKPLSRMQETEADKVGMMFASRACYDYREGAVFWEKIAKIESALENFTIPEWLGTHPDSSKRAKQMNILEDKAVDWRKENALCVPPHVKEVKK